MHDREEILAAQPLHDLLLLGGHRRGVRVVDEEGLHGRGQGRVGEGPAQLAHVQGARARRGQVGTLQGFAADGKGARGGEQDAAPHVAPGPGHRGQAGDGAHRHASSGVPVQAVVDADGRGPSGGVGTGEPLDVGLGQAGDRRRARGGPLLRPLPQLRRPLGVAVEVVLVLEPVAEDHVHHAEGEGGVGPGVEGQVPVGMLRRPRPVGIHGDEPGAAPASLLDEGPEVHVGAHDVGAPGHDEAGVHDGLGIEPEALPHRGLEARSPGARADGPREQAGPELLEEAAVQAAVGEEAHVAGI